jgi:hypothetical protein
VPGFARLGHRTLGRRFVLNGQEGVGKTSLACLTPKAQIIMARGESGYETLYNDHRLPSIPCASVDSWDGLIGLLDQIVKDPGDMKNLVLDALGGFERLCHEKVCARDFKNDWGEKGFASFQKGYDISVTEWLGLLNRLDRLRELGVNSWVISHVQIRPTKNPLGPDFDTYAAACHPKTWGVTAKWADEIWFYGYHVITDKQGGKVKGIGGNARVLRTERSDAWDAKSRLALPPEIDMPNDPMEAYKLVADLLNVAITSTTPSLTKEA